MKASSYMKRSDKCDGKAYWRLKPKPNPALAAFERKVWNGTIDIGLKVNITLADGTEIYQPVPVKESSRDIITIK